MHARKSYVMVLCMISYDSSTAWRNEEERLWGRAHSDAKFKGGIGRGHMQPGPRHKCLSGLS